MDKADHDRLLLHDQAERELFEDPALKGDVLLLALALARRQREGEGARAKNWLKHVAEMNGWSEWQLQQAIHKDAPRYEPPRARYWHGPCEAQMIRRPGPCGQRGGTMVTEYHEDGTETPHYFCNRHKREAAELKRTLPHKREDVRAPDANTGGALMRHFTGDWAELYEWGSPSWIKPPNYGGTILPAGVERPRLRVLPGGAAEEQP